MPKLNPKRGNPYTYETRRFDNQYLDEIQAHHEDNFRHILTKVKMFRFGSRNEARAFLYRCMFFACKDLGMDVQPWMSQDDVMILSKAHGVDMVIKNKPHHFDDYQPQRDYRKLGVYINKHNEIAHFVSVPHKIMEERTDHIVIVRKAHDRPWLIWSTIDPTQHKITIA